MCGSLQSCASERIGFDPFLQRSKRNRRATRRHPDMASAAGPMLEIWPNEYHICLSHRKFGRGGSKYRLNCAKIHQFLTVS